MFSRGIKIWFLGFAFYLVCFGSAWGGGGVTIHFCACFFTAVLLSSVFFSFEADDSRGRGDNTGPVAAVANLAGGPPAFNLGRLVFFGAF